VGVRREKNWGPVEKSGKGWSRSSSLGWGGGGGGAMKSRSTCKCVCGKGRGEGSGGKRILREILGDVSRLIGEGGKQVRLCF